LLYVFRLLFAAAKWLWPYLELRHEGKDVSKTLRLALIAIVGGIITGFLYHVIKALF